MVGVQVHPQVTQHRERAQEEILHIQQILLNRMRVPSSKRALFLDISRMLGKIFLKTFTYSLTTLILSIALRPVLAQIPNLYLPVLPDLNLTA